MDKDQRQGLKQLYLSGKYTTEQLATFYNVTPRQIQRIAKAEGYIRTQAEANRIAAPLKHYHHVPPELRVKRKHISQRIRYMIISDHPFCTNCGARPQDGIRLEVDHINEDATDNRDENLQVLCGGCNTGKSHLKRFK